MTRWRLVFVACSMVGCGVSDYEQRMTRQQERIKTFDEENKVLGDVLDMPIELVKNKEGKEFPAPAWPFEIFLRLPKDVNKKAEEKTFSGEKTVGADPAKLYWFKGKSQNVLVAVGPVGMRDTEGKLKGGLPVKEFKESVLQALNGFLVANHSQLDHFNVIAPKSDERVTLRWKLEGRLEPEKKRAPEVMAFFRQDGARQAAVIYHFTVDRTQTKTDDIVQPTEITLGLRSFDVSDKAKQRRENARFGH